MFPAQSNFPQVSCRCICLAVATPDTASLKKSLQLHTEFKIPCTTRRRNTCKNQTKPDRTFTSSAQRSLSQVSCKSICSAEATIDTANSNKFPPAAHRIQPSKTRALLPHTMPCITRRRNTCKTHRKLAQTYSSPAQRNLVQVSCRSICSAEANIDTANSKKSLPLHTDSNIPMIFPLLTQLHCTTQKQNTCKKQQQAGRACPSPLQRSSSQSCHQHNHSSTLVMLIFTTPNTCNTYQKHPKTYSSPAQRHLSQVSCRCICSAEALQITAIQNKLSLPPPDAPVNLPTSAKVLIRDPLRCKQLGIHRTMKVKYNTSNQVSEKQCKPASPTSKTKRRAKQYAESSSRGSYSSTLKLIGVFRSIFG